MASHTQDSAISFDPYSKCIRFPPQSSAKAAASLEGIIVEMSPGAEAFLAKMIARKNGTIITGEIIDIVDHIDDTSRKNDDANIFQNTSSSPEQIIRHLQSKHAYQTQQLIHQHSTNRHDIENTTAVERKHYLEIMRLMKRQQEEQAEEIQAIIANQAKQMQTQHQVVHFADDGPIADTIIEKLDSYADVPIPASKKKNITITSAKREQQLPEEDVVTPTERYQQQHLQNFTFSEDENDHRFTDPTQRKTNTSTSTEQHDDGGNGIEENSVESDVETTSDNDDDDLSSAASSEAMSKNIVEDDDKSQSSEVYSAASSAEMSNNIVDDDDKSLSSVEEEENVESSYRSGRSTKSTDEGTKDGSLRSFRSGRSGRSGKSNADNSNRSGLHRDGSLR